jgi:FKBP-type peptidyl-prolyl cis-trans isomerase
MKKIILFQILLLSIVLQFAACSKPLPQLPANKGVEIDSAAVSLLTINKTLSLKEDHLLQQYVNTKTTGFQKNELGFWFKIDKRTTRPSLLSETKIHIDYQVYYINGKPIFTENKTIVLGKKQEVRGLEEGLRLMRAGEQATFIVPWYLAYGMKGLEKKIPPYTSVIFKVKVAN